MSDQDRKNDTSRDIADGIGIGGCGDPGDATIEFDSAYLSARMGEIVILAMDGARERIADVFIDVGTRYGESGHQAVYVMCCGLAELIIALGEKAGAFDRDGIGEGAFFAMQVCDPATDEQIDPDSVGQGAKPIVAGHRFVVAYLNDDTQMAMDLFIAEPVLVCVGLSVLAGAFGRHARGDDGDDGDDGEHDGGGDG